MRPDYGDVRKTPLDWILKDTGTCLRVQGLDSVHSRCVHGRVPSVCGLGQLATMNENQVSLKTLFVATVICAIAARIWSVIEWTPALTILGIGCLTSFLASYLFHRATLSAILSGLAASA